MDALHHFFPVSGVQVNILIPPLAAMIISFFSSMAGISGAFLLLPFQMGVLHYAAPSVSGTNHVFNIVAIPSGVYRYMKEGRMVWPLTLVIILGTLPGVFIGYYARIHYLPDPKVFKFFVGCVLLYIGVRLAKDLLSGPNTRPAGMKTPELKARAIAKGPGRNLKTGVAPLIPSNASIRTISKSFKKIEYEFCSERFSFSPTIMLILAFAVGIIGGAYGIGGGSIMAPFCVAVFHLPVYTIAGAALMGTLITSVAGAVIFSAFPTASGVPALPDWSLGILFGLGGVIGMYLGARFQKFMPQRIIKIMLSTVIIYLALRYISQYFLR